MIQHWAYLSYFIFFLIYALAEYTSPRAAVYLERRPAFFQSFKESCQGFIAVIKKMNPLFAVIVSLSICGTITLFIFCRRSSKESDKGRALFRLIVFSLICYFTTVIIGVSYATVAGPKLITSSFLLFVGQFPFLFLATILSIFYLVEHIPQVKAILPFMLLICFVPMISGNRSLTDSAFFAEIPSWQRYEIVSQWIDDIQQADKSGVYEIKITKPKGKFWNNSSIAYTLYQHKMISHPVNIIWE